jgi:hypothetical protein
MQMIALVVLLAATSLASQPPVPPAAPEPPEQREFQIVPRSPEPPAAPEAVPQIPQRRGRVYFYICPKDETMVRVPHSKFTGDLKCPVDGTVMKPGLGQRSAIFLLQ